MVHFTTDRAILNVTTDVVSEDELIRKKEDRAIVKRSASKARQLQAAEKSALDSGTPFNRVDAIRELAGQEVAAASEDSAAGLQIAIMPNGPEKEVETLKIGATNSGMTITANAAEESMPENVRRVVVEESGNQDKKIQSIQRSRKAKASGQEPGLKDSFMDAVTFFLPTAIGALGGALFEGTEGAVAGATEATKLSSAFRQHQLKREEIDQKRKEKEADRQQAQSLADLKASSKEEKPLKIDITSDLIHKKTGEQLFTRENRKTGGVDVITSDGKTVKASLVADKRLLEAKQRNDRLSAQHGGNVERSQLKAANQFVESFKSSNKEITTQIKQLDLARELISNNQLSKDQLGTFNAKAIFGETRITDEDVARGITSQSILNDIKDSPIEAMSGKLGPERKKASLHLLDIIRKRRVKQLRTSAFKQSSPLKAKASGFGKDTSPLREEFERAVNIFEEDKPEKEPSLISVQKQLDIIKRIKARRNK